MDQQQGRVIAIANRRLRTWVDGRGKPHNIMLVRVEKMVGGIVEAQTYAQLHENSIVNLTYDKARGIWTARKH